MKMASAIFRIAACACIFLAAQNCCYIIAAHVHNMNSMRRPLELEDVLRDNTLCFILFCFASIVISYATIPWLVVFGIALSFVFSKKMPALLDARAKKELRSACDEQIDTMSDIVAMGVRSGLSFDAALELYCSKFENELARGIRDTRMQWTSGLASRQQALEDYAAYVGSRALKRFADTSLQAIHHGSPLSEMLARFSADIRSRRKSAIERQIAKAPVKMLIPTGTCILPAMLILVMGPVLLQFIQTGM